MSDTRYGDDFEAARRENNPQIRSWTSIAVWPLPTRLRLLLSSDPERTPKIVFATATAGGTRVQPTIKHIGCSTPTGT